MTEQDIITAADFGSSKITVVIGYRKPDGQVELLGYYTQPSSAIRRGVVINIEQASHDLEKALLEAENMARLDSKKLMVNMSGEHIHSLSASSHVPIKHYNKKIRKIDVYKAMNADKVFKLDLSSELLQVFVKNYRVDEYADVQDPLGMTASELKAELHGVVGSHNVVQNLVAVLDRVGIKLEEIFPSAYYAASSTLSAQEKDLGAICIDVGQGTTDILAYAQNRVIYSNSLALGLEQLSDLIAQKLRVSLQQAKDLQIKHAHVGPLKAGDHPEIVYETICGERFARIAQQEFDDLIFKPIEHVFSTLRRELQEQELFAQAPAGVVLTGGASQIRGLLPWLEQYLACPVRLGSVAMDIQGLQMQLEGPEHAVAKGMIVAGLEQRQLMSNFRPSRLQRMKAGFGSFVADLF